MACAVFAALLMLAVALQFWEGRAAMALLQGLLGAAVLHGLLRELLLLGRDGPCWLELCPGGQMALVGRSGARWRVAPCPSTLRWSRNLLLVLKGPRGKGERSRPVRLLLGPGNVPASQLAALRRQWLRAKEGLTGPLA